MRPLPRLTAAILTAALALTACADTNPLAPGIAPDGPSASKAPHHGFHSWVRMTSDVDVLLEDVWGADERTVFAVGSSGTIQHYDGTRWTQFPTGTTSSLRSVWGSARNDVWAVGGLGALLHFDGSSWTLVDRLATTAGTQYQLYGIWGAAPDDIWTVGTTGTAHHYDGSSWRYTRLPTSQILRSVWGSAPDDVFTVGDGGTLLHFDGGAWTAMPSPTDTRMNAVFGRSANDVYAAGSFGAILHFDGQEWAEDPQSRLITRAHIRDMWGDAKGNIFAVGWGGTILLHDGDEWNLIGSGVDGLIEGVWGSANSRFFAVGGDGLALQGGRGIGAGHAPPGQAEQPIWPLGATASVDADSVHSPYGPRLLPAGYDFHAGIDLPAPRGTPVHAVLSGTVIQRTVWNGTSTGGGNMIIVRHIDGEATGYLHLNTMDVVVGQTVAQGEVIGTVGSTGASYPHLHLGYFRSLNTDAIDERQSYNPLELLPQSRRNTPIVATFGDAAITLDISLQRMQIRSIEVQGEGQERFIDYYAIVRRGGTLRDIPIQEGILLAPTRPAGGRFDLTLTPTDFVPSRVIVTGIDGGVLLDARR